MTDIPAASRSRLVTELMPRLFTEVRAVTCDEGRTRKTLLRAQDGTLIESVLMRYPDRTTLCLSSQAGCGMACPFCATGQAGLTRNLSTAEIVDQVRLAASATRTGALGTPTRLSNIVFMGMGEPLANYHRVVGAIRRLTDPEPDGMGISQRGITVSTVGLVPAMHRLADEGFKCRLAVSLHAPDDELRDTLVPVNTRWKVRAHPRHQRPGVARRPARPAAQEQAGPCEPDPVEPDARFEVDGVPPRGREGVRRGHRGARGTGHHPGHPWPGDRRGLWTAGGGRALNLYAGAVHQVRPADVPATTTSSDRGAPQR
jgi:hypothetical protein